MGVTLPLGSPEQPQCSMFVGDVFLPLCTVLPWRAGHLSPEGTDMGFLWDDTDRVGGRSSPAAASQRQRASGRLEAVSQAFGIPSLAPVQALA